MKMAEVLSNVYDLLFPSPPALKEIIPISIAAQLWRQEINTHRMKNTFHQLSFKRNILSSNSLPRIPSSILSKIETVAILVGQSIELWLSFHQGLFKNEIFNDFIDFAEDFDGSIHHVRTARRLLLCDRIDQILKFKIACTYCFEDDILRMWPSVSANFNLRDISYYCNSVLFYWICRLQHQLYKLPRTNLPNQSIEERFIASPSFLSWSCLEYFWHRLDSESRMRIITRNNQPQFSVKIFFRYLIRTFDETELDRFVNTNAIHIIDTFLKTSLHRKNKGNEKLHALSIWTHLKNKVNADAFVILIRKMIGNLWAVSQRPTSDDVSLYIELWATTPNQLKQHAIQALLLDNSLFEGPLFFGFSGGTTDCCVLFEFLFVLLSDAPIEDRSKFWNIFWSKLVPVMRPVQLDQLMTLCFNNDEKEITTFKQYPLFSVQNVRTQCSVLLKCRNFKELNNLLEFCCTDEKKRNKIRLNLLKKLNVNTNDITFRYLVLNDFINDAYSDNNAAKAFKTRLLSAPFTVTTLKKVCDDGNFHHVLRFIDTLAPSQQIARDCKRLHVLPVLRQKLQTVDCFVHFEELQFSNFLLECLGNDDEITRFKQTLNADEIVQGFIRSATHKTITLKYSLFLVEFLEWYFSTPQALEEFKSRYAEDDVFVQFTNKSE